MVDVRNLKRKYTFKHILFRKPFSYLTTLGLFHNNNSISPRDLFFSNWFSVIKTCRFSFKSRFEQLLSRSAPVLVLVANKQHPHNFFYKAIKNINFAKYCILLFLTLVLAFEASALKIGVGPEEIILSRRVGQFSVFNPNPGRVEFSVSGGKGMFFNQTKGFIEANSKADVKLEALESGNILVRFLHDNLEPGIQIRVRKPDIPNYGLWIFLLVLGSGMVFSGLLFLLWSYR